MPDDSPPEIVAVINWEDTLVETLLAALEQADVRLIWLKKVTVTDDREDTQTLMAGRCDMVVAPPGEWHENYLTDCRFEINHGRGPDGIVVGEVEVIIRHGAVWEGDA